MVWFHSELTWENIHINLVEIPLACILAMIFGLIFVSLKDDVHQTAPLDKIGNTPQDRMLIIGQADGVG